MLASLLSGMPARDYIVRPHTHKTEVRKKSEIDLHLLVAVTGPWSVQLLFPNQKCQITNIMN